MLIGTFPQPPYMQVGFTPKDAKYVLVAPISEKQRNELYQKLKLSSPVSPVEFNKELEDYSSVYSCKLLYVYKLSLLKVSVQGDLEQLFFLLLVC